jgi:peroxiredoxin
MVVLALMAAAPSEAQYQVGDPVADFTLNDADGNPVSLYDYDGNVIWLVFWTDT